MHVDLCMQYSAERAAALLETAVDSGFSGVVWNETVDLRSSAEFQSRICFPAGANFTSRLRGKIKPALMSRQLADLGLEFKEFPLQASRLTVITDEADRLTSLSRLGKFDILAVRPVTEKAFASAVASGPVDIIQVDLTLERLPFSARRQLLLQAARRELYFEFCLDEVLQSQARVRLFFRHLLPFVRFLPHKLILLTTGAASPLSIRGPADLQNLARLAGVKGENLVRRILSQCHL
ncbi:MAG: uncharacterized protein KVP18_000948 [Porospora cf. gigantea A]|uniref:uncharacterized protein n=1 Tax=Porospora cf. gigantea A TaxID=2853593 RepID=UPI003559B02A|nr:MAG: hypothetical protein KVP18_000948 [Porospora cf. gigantea A]